MDRARSRLEIAQRRIRSALSPKPNPGLPGFGHSLLVVGSGQARSRLGEEDRPAPAGRKGIPPLPQRARQMNAIDHFVMDITAPKPSRGILLPFGRVRATACTVEPTAERGNKTSSLAVAAAALITAGATGA